ncbi:CocE/NonD family hydrolase C-terminal non-catalytic domain-containing protein [Sphingobium cyanobacteriorum]|uniref:CocE/NonD family hydrolase C-terminal non-catalytic domain-containing protein n=1 Tax=Sphingobium cyanobacteriorum TaxID=3063954 RepID=UPI003CC5852D
MPFPPGVTENIVFTFFPISTMVRAGHRIRISLAGADADYYERVSVQGATTYTFSFGGNAPSYVDLLIVAP